MNKNIRILKHCSWSEELTEKFQFLKRSTINLQCNFFLLFKKYTINCANFWLPFIFPGLKWMEWVGPLQLNSHLVQRGTKRLWVELRKFSNANLCKLSDSCLNIYCVVKMWYYFILFFLFLYIHIFSFLSSFNSLPLIHTNTAGSCMVHSILLVAIPLRATPGTSPALRAQGWGILSRG